MARPQQSPPERAQGKDAVVQWILAIVCALVALVLGVVLVAGIVVTVMESAFDRYGVPLSLTAGLFILFVLLTRNRICRLVGRPIPPGSGGGIYV